NVALSATAHLDRCGSPAGVLAIARPVSARDAEERGSPLIDSGFHAVFNACPVPMVLGGQKILIVNREFVRVFGYDEQDVPTLADWRRLAYPDPAYRQWVADSWTRRLEE